MEMSNAITSEQLRAARALLGLSQMELADEAGITRKTVYEMEQGAPVRAGNVAAVRKVLEDRGVEFVDAGKKVGVIGPSERGVSRTETR